MSSDVSTRIKANKRSSGGKGLGIRYAVTEMKGWRSEMEDAHCALEIKELGWWFFGVFDGHGGDYTSRHAAEKLWEYIFKELSQANKGTGCDELNEEEVIKAIKQGFYNFDASLRNRAVAQDTDSSYLYPSFLDKSGTTVIACLITKKRIFLINCGDSRGILVRRPKKLELVTFDHKPSQLKEKQRIQNAGGMIALNRVNGGLATSRGLGDFEYKCVPELPPHQQFVSPEPDFYVIDRDPKNDHFVLLACDGVWDVKDSRDVMNYLSDKIDSNGELENIANEFVDSCFDAGSKDNISVVLINFQPEQTNGANENSSNSVKLPKISTNVPAGPTTNHRSTMSA